MPATAGSDAASRIVPKLDGLVALPRTDIDVVADVVADVVVTKHGAADLRGLPVVERGERLIAIAAPQHRSALIDAWRELTRRA